MNSGCGAVWRLPHVPRVSREPGERARASIPPGGTYRDLVSNVRSNFRDRTPWTVLCTVCNPPICDIILMAFALKAERAIGPASAHGGASQNQLGRLDRLRSGDRWRSRARDFQRPGGTPSKAGSTVGSTTAIPSARPLLERLRGHKRQARLSKQRSA